MPFALGFKDKMITRDGSGLRGYFWQGSKVNNGLECDRMLSGPLSLKCTAFKEIIESENRMSISIYIFEEIEVRRYSSKRVGKLWNSHFTEREREFTRNKDCCSVAQLCLILCNPMDCNAPGFPALHHLPVCSDSCPSSQWCHPTISSSVTPSPPAFDLSQHQGLFQWVGSSIRWPKYWSFSFNISPSNEYSGLISFRIEWFALAVQGILRSHLQHHSSKTIILRHSAFFMVQISHLYMTTGKTIAWQNRPLLAKWCLWFLICYLGFIIAFLQRSKNLKFINKDSSHHLWALAMCQAIC